MNVAVEQRIIQVVAEQANINPARIKAGSTLDALGISSLQQIEIFFAIEEAFDVDLPGRPDDPSLAGLVTLISDLVENR
jgi:acyl carrier protein